MGAEATFVVYEDAAGQSRWRLLHDNGNIIAEGGQGYASKQGAINGIESVKANAPAAAVEFLPAHTPPDGADPNPATVELYRDAAGQWRWRLVHANGNIIAEGGQGYTSKSGAHNGVESVRRNAPTARIEEHRIEEIGDP